MDGSGWRTIWRVPRLRRPSPRHRAPAPFAEPEPEPPRWRVRLRRLVIGGGITFLVLVAGTALAGLRLFSSYEHSVGRISGAFPPESRRFPLSERPGPSGGERWLVVGSDRRGLAGAWPGRADVLMLVYLPDDGSHLDVLSLPRDSWVPVPGHGQQKINNSYALGGPPLLIETVEKLMGCRFDHFAVLDFGAFQTVIDTLGGIDLRERHLNGEEALRFVRNRHFCRDDLCGDRARIERQQVFLRALADRVSDTSLLINPLRLDTLIRAVARSVSVDDSVDLRGLAARLARSRFTDLRLRRAPSVSTWRGPQSVVLLDLPHTRELWAGMTGAAGASGASGSALRAGGWPSAG